MFMIPLAIVVELALAMPRNAASRDIGSTNYPVATRTSRVEPTISRSVENAVLFELNRARTDPAAFARSLGDQRGYYRGNLLDRPGAGAIFLTQEGVVPVDEAIAFVAHKAAGTALRPAPVLAAAAADHQVDQQASGTVGHAGQDGSGPGDRVRRHGGDRYVGELIAYGATDPADIVRQLVVDDGVADRGHRRLLYDTSLRYAGVSCGTHPVYRYMCVVTLGRTPDGQASRGGVARDETRQAAVGRDGTTRRS